MDYTDSGFNQLLERPFDNGAPGEVSSLDYDALLESISADKIQGGTFTSQTNQNTLNLDTGTQVINDGTRERIRIGLMEDGSYGLRVQDQDGNILINITGTTNLIQSANGHVQFDLTEEQIRIYDETKLRALFGKAFGKF